MTFQSEFRSRLESGEDHEELLQWVRKQKTDGLGQRDAYDQLQDLWLQFGFDDDEGGENPIRDNLEYVMEVVWGFCPSAIQIWESSLSQQNQPT